MLARSVVSTSALHARRLSTATANAASSSSSPTSLYSFKSQLDDYIYFHSLSSQWRPLVYRQRNADVLTSLNALDKKNHPLIPLKYPGVPSQKKLTKFISLLLTTDELNIIRKSLDDLYKIRITKKKFNNSSKDNDKNNNNNKNNNYGKYLEPSIINQFLYKSYELNPKLFNSNLVWVDQINEKDSVWSVKNTEAVSFIRSMIIKSNFSKNNNINLNSMIEKMQHWIKKSNMNENGSILYNSSIIIASIYSNVLNENLIYLNNLDNLTKDKVFTVKPDTDYLHYDHAYSIISALKDASIKSENDQLKSLVSRWDNFLSDVEKLKGSNDLSTYERILKADSKRAEDKTVTEQAIDAEKA
ncbi:hypothetical protein C6P40_001183 [Pichia californica]|uniref:Uncharacterized protein n=1 Tax=Pichia californica TaxID=460514 RepID=A0A9P6WJJ8_9ASCO|nr:hypothetical protein C6P40_001183 [[Candida] californica]